MGVIQGTAVTMYAIVHALKQNMMRTFFSILSKIMFETAQGVHEGDSRFKLAVQYPAILNQK